MVECIWNTKQFKTSNWREKKLHFNRWLFLKLFLKLSVIVGFLEDLFSNNTFKFQSKVDPSQIISRIALFIIEITECS